MKKLNEFKISQKAVIIKGNKALIVRRAKDEWRGGFWEIPGGSLRFGEPPTKALRRELLEECKIAVSKIEPINVWHFREGKKWVIGITYKYRFKSGKITLSKEHDEYSWIRKKDINKFKLMGGIKKEIIKAFSLK